jgi:hypothetical protein
LASTEETAARVRVATRIVFMGFPFRELRRPEAIARTEIASRMLEFLQVGYFVGMGAWF